MPGADKAEFIRPSIKTKQDTLEAVDIKGEVSGRKSP